MLIHGRLLVTQNGLMLDEVKSLLQKSLRRQEHSLTNKAAKELIGEQKVQLKWQNIVTFMFEDHCLNHVTVFEKLFDLYKRKKMFGSIELISKCYTCRYSACLQVVAISEKYRNYEEFWDDKIPEDSNLQGLVGKVNKGINCDLLFENIVKKWRENEIDPLVSLFGLVNMAAKVEGRKLTGKGIKMLLDQDMKTPTLYHLVLSILYYRTDDEYMKRVIRICFRFISIPETPQGLIMFTVLSQLTYKDTVLRKQVANTHVGQLDWEHVGKLNSMPEWAVDKHTYRGKFGKSSEHLFLKKYKHMNLSKDELEEFHGERPKVGIQNFFDIGCICKNDILLENPIWEEAKEMYLKQKPSMQKCAKMTKLYYTELLDKKNIVMVKRSTKTSEEAEELPPKQTVKRKQSSTSQVTDGTGTKKMKLIEDYMTRKDKTCSVSIAEQSPSAPASDEITRILHPEGPLLQLPTGSGKVYTVLDTKSQKVWKGPYKSKQRQNLCLFLHRAMRGVFGDKHTMETEEKGQYIIFPLLKSEDADVSVTHRAFYDCISKSQISEDDGMFVERHSLGIVQLHKLSTEEIRRVPASVWSHFAWRYCLNIGDTGLYNAIATKDLGTIYGIDMEEKRAQIKGNDVMNMMFGKMPRKELVREIEKSLLSHVEEFYSDINKDIDFDVLEKMYIQHGVENETEQCKRRLANLTKALETMCKLECGV